MVDSDNIVMQEKLLTFLQHIKSLMTQIVCNHLVATGRLLSKMGLSLNVLQQVGRARYCTTQCDRCTVHIASCHYSFLQSGLCR